MQSSVDWDIPNVLADYFPLSRGSYRPAQTFSLLLIRLPSIGGLEVRLGGKPHLPQEPGRKYPNQSKFKPPKGPDFRHWPQRLPSGPLSPPGGHIGQTLRHRGLSLGRIPRSLASIARGAQGRAVRQPGRGRRGGGEGVASFPFFFGGEGERRVSLFHGEGEKGSRCQKMIVEQDGFDGTFPV